MLHRLIKKKNLTRREEIGILQYYEVQKWLKQIENVDDYFSKFTMFLIVVQ